MADLPIVHMTLYKHGIGFYRRTGRVSGNAVSLTFPAGAMDDLLKSLTVIDKSDGQVLGIDYDTPQSIEEKLAGCAIDLRRAENDALDAVALRSLLESLQGRRVNLSLNDEPSLSGTLVGLDDGSGAQILHRSVVSLLADDTDTVNLIPLSRISAVTLLDKTAAEDLRFYLKTNLGQEAYRAITVRLTPGEHDLSISYIAPAPTWRVSYRLVAQTDPAETTEALLQGWGIFDNRLEEDLNSISLSLTAGMPISFEYDLYTPHTPKRPTVENEDRTVAAPIDFEAELEDVMPAPAPMMMAKSRAPGRLRETAGSYAPAAEAPPSMDDFAGSVSSAAQGESLGEVFQYNIQTPVTVGRGQSAMAPIVSNRFKTRKDLIFNQNKYAKHPVATIRLTNDSPLTLERGPITVLDQGEYVGEAMFPFTPAGDEAVIAYAVELAIHVTVKNNNSWTVHRLEVGSNLLVEHRYHITETVYHLDNRTPETKTVLLEYDLPLHHEIFDTPDPSEKTRNTHRYAVEVPSKTKTRFVIKARRLHAERLNVSQLSYNKLADYLKRNLLTDKLHDQLKHILKLHENVQRAQTNIDKAEKRQAAIYQQQAQIQQNIQALGTRGEEGSLRSEYVRKLRETERRLEDLEKSRQHAAQRIQELETEIEKMLNNLG